MSNEPLENETPENETEVVEPESTEEKAEETPAEEPKVVEEAPADDSALKSALAQKDHFRKKAEEAERKLAQAKRDPASNTALDVEDYIDISSSLSGLDPVEQAYLAKQHKLTGQPMKEIRESEDFQLWDSAYQQKLEKERALAPNTTQEDEEVPQTVVEKLRNKSIAEKEELLREAGLYKENKPRQPRVNIGEKINPVIK